METLAQMRERHRRERANILPMLRQRQRRELVEKLKRMANDGMTQTETAQALGATRTAINNLVMREGIDWPVKRQGSPSRDVTPEHLRRYEEQANG